MEEDAICVLLDLRGDFEAGQAEGGGRGLCQRRGLSRGCAQGMVEGLGGARQQKPRGIGPDGRGGGAGTVASPLDRCAGVCAMPPGAGEVCIDRLRRRRLSGRDDTARRLARRHDCGGDHHAPGFGPHGGRGERLIHPAAGGRALPIGWSLGRPLLRVEGRARRAPRVRPNGSPLGRG